MQTAPALSSAMHGKKNIPVAKQPKWLRMIAGFVSYLMHPLFVPVYVLIFIVYIHPTYFSGFSDKQKLSTILISTINLVVFPMISVLLLRALKFIDSVYMRTQKDRIVPYIAYGIFSFWAYTVFKEQAQYPPIIPCFLLGVFLAGSMALLCNIYFKISMHSMGAGGLVGIALLISFSNTMLMSWPLALAVVIAGLICTSRLLLGAHKPRDIYAGLLVGIAAQYIAAVVVLS